MLPGVFAGAAAPVAFAAAVLGRNRTVVTLAAPILSSSLAVLRPLLPAGSPSPAVTSTVP